MNLEFWIITFDVFVFVEITLTNFWREIDAPLGVGKFHLVQKRKVVLKSITMFMYKKREYIVKLLDGHRFWVDMLKFLSLTNGSLIDYSLI